MDKLEGEGDLEVIKGCRIIKYTPNGFVCGGGEGRYMKKFGINLQALPPH